MRNGEGDKGGVLEGLQDEGLHIRQLGSVRELGTLCPIIVSAGHRGQTGLRGCPDCSMVSPIIPSATQCGVTLYLFTC